MAQAGVDWQLRADAERNRQSILAAARRVFAEEGLGVSMRRIAQRAGVGEPTLRRRFPTKADLVSAVFEDKAALYADTAAGLADPDPWHGFSAFVGELARMQLGDRGFTKVLTMTFPRSLRLETAVPPVTEPADQARAAPGPGRTALTRRPPDRGTVNETGTSSKQG